MNRSRVLSTLVAASMAVLAVTACNAQVLSLGDGGSTNGGSTNGGPSGTALPDIAASTTIASLSDAQASDLCNWLMAVFPDPNKTVPPADSSRDCGGNAPGYVSSRTLGCGDQTHPFSWVILNVSDCTANLRHSPCHATIDSLEQCIAAFREAFDARDYCSAAPGCSAYWADPACIETVLEAKPYGINDAYLCSSCLPLESGVSCPAASSAADGGGD